MAQNKTNDVKPEAVLPVLASAMLEGAGATNPQLQEYIAALLGDQLAARDKEKAKRERLAMNSVQAAQEAELARAQKQSQCSHLKQDDTTRLVGQRLTGTRQIALVCQFCAKEYHMPPLEGQEAPPRDLLPSADIIGG